MVSSAKVITNEIIEKVLKYQELIPAIEVGLKHFSNNAVIQPVRSILPLQKYNGFFAAMPAYIFNQDVLAIKCLCFHAYNTKHQLPTHQAQISLYDSSNGKLLAVMDADVITGMRTAAASVVATKYLAKDDPKVLAILGSGHQGESHIFALSSLYSFEKIYIWNRTPQNGLKLCEKVKSLAKTVKFCHIPEEAVVEADIVVTATSTVEPILCGKWLKEGVHINCIGACRPDLRELNDDCMAMCDVYVDSKASACEESGDIILSKKEVVGEIGEVVSGNIKADKNKRTIFKSLGIAVEDAVTANIIWKHMS